MPYTSAGIYYPDTSTDMSVADITQAMAESIGPQLGILQVVSASYNTSVLTTSTSYVDSMLTATITPKSTTSKIIAFVNMPFYATASAGTQIGGWFRLVKDGVQLVEAADYIDGFYSATPKFSSVCNMIFSGTPTYGAANIYKVQGKVFGAFYNTNLNMNNASNSPATSRITLMEVSG
jgi:hypothetical protein